MKFLRCSAFAVKILLGMLFVFSAVSKFISIDLFEVYVYSFGFFSLNLSFYVARLVVAAELILGAALISNRNHRFTVLMTLLFLVAFIVFLTYAQLIGRTDNCHCFGELAEFNPVQSILKNAVLIVLLLFVFKYSPLDWSPRWWLAIIVYILLAVIVYVYMVRMLHVLDQLAFVMLLTMLCVGLLASFPFYSKWYVTAALVLAPVVATFILSPPDSWFYMGTAESYDKALFQGQIKGEVEVQTETEQLLGVDTIGISPLADMGLDSGRHLVAFFSPRCGFCRLAAEKVSTIVNRHKLDCESVLYVFPQVSDTDSYNQFYEESRSSRFREVIIDKIVFIRITRASFPLVLLIDNGDVAASFSYRNIDEKLVADFLGNKDYRK